MSDDLNQLIAEATTGAAPLLEARAQMKDGPLKEEDLEQALLKALDELGQAAVKNRRLPTPDWQPQPGNTDLILPSVEEPRVVAELKWCSENKVYEALWDMIKMASATGTETTEAAYLIYAAPEHYWQKPVECAEEIFFRRASHITALIHDHLDWWRRFILGDSTGRPLKAPRVIEQRVVCEPRLEVAAKSWQIRAIRVAPASEETIPFYAGMPPAAWPTMAIERYFDERFSHWGITLPREEADRRKAGHIFKGGWHIGYRWGYEDGEEFLEFLAQHRMTNDSHVRVFASGKSEPLEAPVEFQLIRPEASPEDQQRDRERYFRENERIYSELRDKGLLPPTGENLASHDINEYLRSGGDA